MVEGLGILVTTNIPVAIFAKWANLVVGSEEE